MPDLHELAWPVVIAVAWVTGEISARWRIPRICAYAAVGFLAGSAQLGVLPAGGGGGALLAQVAFGLILFEFGYRINLHWFRLNPWLTASGLLEASLSLAGIYAVARLMGAPPLTALLLGTLGMASSPAALLRVINDLRSSGQVTERALHLAALNCVLAAFTFKAVLGFWTFDTSGDLLRAVSSSALVLLASAALGLGFGLAMGWAQGLEGPGGVRDGTLAFAVAVLLLVALTHAFKLSPLLAALTFGLASRHRRSTLAQAQRNFGALGDLLVVFLFVHVAASVEWQRVLAGAGLGTALVMVRMAVKVGAVTLLARASGTSWRKGALTGLALTPMSVFVVLLLEDTRHLGIDLLDTLAALAAATLLLDLLGPLVAQAALRAAGEAADQDEVSQARRDARRDKGEAARATGTFR